jgi:hypothetical protein
MVPTAQLLGAMVRQLAPRLRLWGFRLPAKVHPICTHMQLAWLLPQPTGVLVMRSSCISFLGQEKTDLAR